MILFFLSSTGQTTTKTDSSLKKLPGDRPTGQTTIKTDNGLRNFDGDSSSVKNKGLFLEPVEITAIRAGDKSPFTKLNINAGQIAKTNNGQDLPYILDQTPSVVVGSDAGNGIGYTNISIRGTDASRINMTLNGLPYNDAESQAIYFVDLPDFASSTNSIQIQRGVGTSSNGAGAFGATMNFSSNAFFPDPYAEFNNSFGSFNSWKNTLKAGSGLIGGHFTVDMRLSRISSNGYIDRATSDLKSAYFSTAYISNKTSIRFNIIMGSEKTYQAWNGVPESKLYGDSAQLQQETSSKLAAETARMKAEAKAQAATEKLANEGDSHRRLPACLACHINNSGGPIETPVITGQSEEYLLKQLNDFASGNRKNDVYGRMRDVASKLTPEERTALARYFQGTL